jgi:hypothetical protein
MLKPQKKQLHRLVRKEGQAPIMVYAKQPYINRKYLMELDLDSILWWKVSDYFK